MLTGKEAVKTAVKETSTPLNVTSDDSNARPTAPSRPVENRNPTSELRFAGPTVIKLAINIKYAVNLVNLVRDDFKHKVQSVRARPQFIVIHHIVKLTSVKI